MVVSWCFTFLKFTFLLFYNTVYYFYISMFTYLPKVSHAVFKLKIIALDFPNLCDMTLCLALMMQSLKGNPILTASFNLLMNGWSIIWVSLTQYGKKIFFQSFHPPLNLFQGNKHKKWPPISRQYLSFCFAPFPFPCHFHPNSCPNRFMLSSSMSQIEKLLFKTITWHWDELLLWHTRPWD